MVIRTPIRALLAAFVFSAVCGAQSAPAAQKPAAAPCPAAGQTATSASTPCTPAGSDAAKPSTADQFPFPGEVSKPSATPDAPSADAPTPNAPHPSAASEHPFPSAADSSGSSSSSSSDDDASTPADVPPHDDSQPTTRRKLPKVRKLQTDDERVDEDLKVARFYVNDDNLPGAYLRAKDAVKVQPEYSETHFVLAQVAQKMKKKDEAIAEYKAYLKLDPNGEQMNAAQRALAELQ